VICVPRNAGRGARCTSGTVATTAIITEPADFGADARATLIELRDGYIAET
jgi:hypothetical protein